MEYFLIAIVSFFSSVLTLFSGFGINTLLVPAFAVFFPIKYAIVLTSIVHFISNIFKLTIFGKYLDKKVVLNFGIPAMLFALLGAISLEIISKLTPLITYKLFNNEFSITPIKLTISLLMIIFALFDLIPRLQKISFEKKYLPIGGMLSGFIGGLSGHQGGLRSAFLIKCNLSKESFIGTGVVIATLVDASRLFIYKDFFKKDLIDQNLRLLIFAVGSAMLGIIVGNFLLRKITINTIQTIVGIMVIGTAISIGLGLI